MSKRRQVAVTPDRVTATVVPGLFAILPLLYDADLYQFALLPKLIGLQVGLLVVSAVWALRLYRGEATWSSPETFLPATLFMIWSAVSCLGADLNTFTSTVFLAHQLTFFFAYVVLSQTITVETVDRILKWTCISALLYSSIGILEFWGLDTGDIPSNGRPSSTFAYRNFAATFLAASLPLLLIRILRCERRIDLLLGTLSALVVSLFLVYTRSRGAWLGAVASLLLGGLLFFRSAVVPPNAAVRSRGWHIPGVAIILLLGLSPWSPQIRPTQSRAIDEGKIELLDAMSSLSTSGAGRGRLALWSNSLQIAQDHPVAGIGLGNWKLAYPSYDDGQMVHVGSAPERPHNDFLWIVSEVGIPGLVFYLLMLGVAILRAIRAIANRDTNAILVIGFLSSLIAILGHSVFSFPRERVEASFFLWGALGILHALTRDSRKVTPSLIQPTLIPALITLCIGITILEIRFDRARLASLQSFAGGDMISLESHTREGLSAGPFDSQIFLLRNKVDQANRNYLRAQQTCREGLKYHPNSVELLGDLGMAYALGDNTQEAEAVLLRATELSPNHYQIFNNLGGVYHKTGELDKAEQAYIRATTVKSDYSDAWSNLGLLQMMQGKPGRAVESLTKAVALTNNDPALHHNLADAFYLRDSAGDHQSAAKHYEIFLRAWRGDTAETAIARSRLREIRSAP
jgi:O-antigen ligase/Tfp pilus assembly protein PilF